MPRTRDFRPDAVNLASIVNAKAGYEGRTCVVELDTDEFVHIHCGNMIFIVFRDVITAGSMYFECSLFGFFKEAYSQEITFDEGVDSEALELYLNLTHSWFFEIKFRGIQVVPAENFNSLIEAFRKEPFQRAHLKIPQLKLRKLAEAVILADRFLHRSLLCILRQIFLSLVDTTHKAWDDIKKQARETDELYHVEFIADYMDAFEFLSMGHDDEFYLRSALTESFYWLTLNTPDLRNRFLHLMSERFINESNQDRSGHSETERIDHAKGIFVTDQYCYESVTRIQKQRRYKRVVNMCPFEDQKDVFPWVEDPQDRRIRVNQLHASVCAINRSARRTQNRANRFREFVPGAASHPISAGNGFNHVAAGGGSHHHAGSHARGGRRGSGLRGRGRGYRSGRYQQSHGSHRQIAPDNGMELAGQLNNLNIWTNVPGGVQQNHGGNASTVSQASQWPGVMMAVLPSNQTIKWSGVNSRADTFNKLSQMQDISNSIQSWVTAGGHDALQYLRNHQSQFLSHSQQNQSHQSPSSQTTQSERYQVQQFNSQQSSARLTEMQQCESCVADLQHEQNENQQRLPQQTTKCKDQGFKKKPNKYRKKKKQQQQIPNTEQSIWNLPSGPSTIPSSLYPNSQAEKHLQPRGTGNCSGIDNTTTNTGDAASGGVTSDNTDAVDTNAPHSVFNPAIQLQNNANGGQHQNLGQGNGRGLGQHRRGGYGYRRGQDHENF